MMEVAAGRWKDENVNEQVQMEWDLHYNFGRALEKIVPLYKPTLRQLLLEEFPKNYQHRKFSGVIQHNGEVLKVKVWGLHPIDKFDIWVEVSNHTGKLGRWGLAPRGVPTRPNNPTVLKFCSEVFVGIENKYLCEEKVC